jgi:cell division septation protein DedD
MRNNETGEFELTVGNRQLLSGFFIVVLLFAVAFAMGYVVGQNSPRSAKLAAETAAASPPVSEPRPPAAGPAAPPKTEPAPAPTETAAAQPAASEPAPPQQPITQPVRDTPAAAANPDAPPVLADLPGPAGSFWQVIAVAEPDAQVIASALKKKGFPAFLSPGSKNLMRVMVGPYNDAAALGKAKTDLASAGFPNPFRK